MGQRLNLNFGRKFPKSSFREGNSRKRQRFPGSHDGADARGFRHRGQRGDVTCSDIFGESGLHGAANFFRLERLHPRRMAQKILRANANLGGNYPFRARRQVLD